MGKNTLKLHIEEGNIYLNDGRTQIHFGKSFENFLRFCKVGVEALKENQKVSKYKGLGYDFIEKDAKGGEIHFEYDFANIKHSITYKAVFENNITKKQKGIIKLDVFKYCYEGEMNVVINWLEDLVNDARSFVQVVKKGQDLKGKKERKILFDFISDLSDDIMELQEKYSKL